MISVFSALLATARRLIAFSRVELQDSAAVLLAHAGVRFHTRRTSRILIRGGSLRIGFNLPGTIEYANQGLSQVWLGENARFIVEGPVAIAPGATIRVGENATLRLMGHNFIGHNCTLICNKNIELGRGANLSWNVTLIDDDQHRFIRDDGRRLRKFVRPLVVGAGAGIQMNVLVPSGVNIGEESIICAGTVVRRDIPAFSTAYSDQQLVIKSGIRTAGALFCSPPNPKSSILRRSRQ